ncbi:MAG: methionine ABC transporter ATP-binding protein [Bacillaceae bacterium]
MITIKDVVKKYKTKSGQVVAVDNVSLQIKQGEIFGVIGYSGAGKSSLIRLFNQLEAPTSGDVLINGKVISKLKGRELREARQDIGMIFQHFNLLWSRTVRENIELPLEIAGYSKAKRRARSKELIELVGLTGREDSYPSQLSGGQKQRVGIARALANKPSVLLCDEATSALDPETTNQILDLLVEINQKMKLTIVLITHEMHVIKKVCHRVAVMESGKVVESGSVLEVFSQPKQEITKRFVGQLLPTNEDVKDAVVHLQQKTPSGKVLKLTFVGDVAEQPIIMKLVQDFKVEVNILQGGLTTTAEKMVGQLSIHLNGEKSEVERAITYLHECGVKTEVTDYAS